MRRGPRLPLDQLAPYLLIAPAEPAGPLDWAQVFGNDRPVELEVGFGKGLFLLAASAARPDVNFVGIEIVRKYQLFTATRLAKRQRGNVRVACADARLFFPQLVRTGSLQAIHVYFPDPWWKTRHHKRRVFTDAFARECQRCLAPGGRLHFVSDVAEYQQMVAELVAEHTTLRPLPPPEPTSPAHEMDYLTNFERKFRQEGRPIYRLLWEKPEVASPG